MGENLSEKPSDEMDQKNVQQEDIQEKVIIEIDEAELKKLQDDASEHKEKYLRLLAENENSRKRMQKEKQELMKYAIQDLATDFLNPLDSMNHALKFAENMSEEVSQWATGFKMILAQMEEVLSSHDIKPFSSVGKRFDPHDHEAVETIETDEFSEDTIIEELLQGYKMGDRTIRPARVKVAKKPSEEKNNQSQESSQKEQLS